MLQKFFYVGCFIVTGLFYQSCYRDTETFIPDVVQIDEYIEALKRPSQTFTINTAEPGTITITTAGRAVFRFPNGGYYFTASGETVSGNITVQIKEIYRKGDMIRENATTMTTDNKLLVSGGMFQLTMSQNSQPVSLREDRKIQIDIPSENTGSEQPLAGMQVFQGFPSGDSISNGQIIWQTTASSDTVIQSAWYDAVNQIDELGYSLTTSGYEWINCDYWDPGTSFVNCTFNLPPEATNMNTRVYILYDGINALQQAVWWYGANPSFGASIAADRNVKIVVLHVDNDFQMKFSFKQQTITSNTVIETPLETTTIAQLRDFLDAL